MFYKFKKKAIEKAAMKMIKEDFTLDDFLNQLNKLGKIGNLSKRSTSKKPRLVSEPFNSTGFPDILTYL